MSLGSMRLRLESGDGSAAKEYRIEDGNVEGRTLDPEGGSPRHTGSVWWRLTPEQLSIHLERKYCGRSVARASARLETFIAGMCGPRSEYVESCREHKSSSSLMPPFEMAHSRRNDRSPGPCR